MFYKKINVTLFGLLLTLFSSSVLSQETQYRVFCDKLKTCMVDNMKAQGAYQPGMEQFIDGMLEQTCQQGLTEYQTFIDKSKDDAEMQKKTKACLDSFLDASCDAMIAAMGQGQSVTPACQDAEQYADQKGYRNNS